MAFIKCTKCQKMFNTEKAAKKHRCIPALATLGTNQMGRLRGSSIGRQIDGSVELAYLRGKQAAEEKETKLLLKIKRLQAKNKKIKQTLTEGT